MAPEIEGGIAGLAAENLQARVRGVLLMALSNTYGWLVVSTGNKSELAVGYSTLYGDMVGGFALLKDVFKTDVYRLAALGDPTRQQVFELLVRATLGRCAGRGLPVTSSCLRSVCGARGRGLVTHPGRTRHLYELDSAASRCCATGSTVLERGPRPIQGGGRRE